MSLSLEAREGKGPLAARANVDVQEILPRYLELSVTRPFDLGGNRGNFCDGTPGL
jgi:hypothetical protein